MAAPILNWPAAERVGHALTNPVAGALLMSVVMFAWHTPSLYELALGSEFWHEVEHVSFLIASLIFWWPVVLPWPGRAQWPRWAMVPYLLLADLQNTALSAILVGLSALEDQVAAGSFMWVAGSFAFILPAIVIAVQCLSMSSSRHALSTT
jgi:cytochrome c oxidase assembly factor CtaG